MLSVAKKAFIASFLTTSVLLSSQIGIAQEERDSIGSAIRVDQLENRLAAMEKKLFATPMRRPVTGEITTDVNTLVADMEARIGQLEEEWQRMYGSVEELGHSIKKLTTKIDVFAQDVNLRLEDLENNTGAAPMADTKKSDFVKKTPKMEKDGEKAASKKTVSAKVKTSPAVTKARQSVPTDAKAEDIYKKAYSFVTAAAYDDARGWFEELLSRHPKHALADNSNYWLGEVHLVQNNPAQAVLAFSNGIKTFPKGEKASANLLKLGVAFERMGQNKHAKSSWTKLVKDFPDSPEAEKAQKKLDALDAVNNG